MEDALGLAGALVGALATAEVTAGVVAPATELDEVAAPPDELQPALTIAMAASDIARRGLRIAAAYRSSYQTRQK
jgi:hypothetical protein